MLFWYYSYTDCINPLTHRPLGFYRWPYDPDHSLEYIEYYNSGIWDRLDYIDPHTGMGRDITDPIVGSLSQSFHAEVFVSGYEAYLRNVLTQVFKRLFIIRKCEKYLPK
jgi:hypothetical protein